MSQNNFECQRYLVEQIYQRPLKNVLLQEYCSGNYSSIDLVDVYYRNIDENAIVMFVVILILFPMLFMLVGQIADKYLSDGMADLATRLKMSPAVAAVSLIAFANGAPDVLNSIQAASKKGGNFIAVGCLLGGYIFSSTLVVSNVIFAAGGDIQVPKLTIMKELVFYFLAVITIIIFGFIKKISWTFVGIYLFLYGCYWIATIMADKIEGGDDKQQEVNGELEGELANDFDEENQQEQPKDEEQVDDNEQPEQQKDDEADKNELKFHDDEITPEEKAMEQKIEGIMIELVRETVPEDGGLVDKIVIMPLNFMGLFTVCYLQNPLMKTPVKYIICAVSVVFFLYYLELTPFDLLVLWIIGAFIGFITLLLDLAKVSENTLSIIFEIISVFAAIGWISIVANVIIDFITFIAFYFNLNEIILSALLLSAGNTVGDFFGNAALAMKGEQVMGTIASYAGFGVNSLAATLIDNTSFDLFAQDYYKGEGAENKSPPTGLYFLQGLIVIVLFIITTTFIYLSSNSFRLQKSFGYMMIGVYVTFFGGSITLALLTRE